eukprot:TRINITY_DN16767_c0_g1_i1.p1 TRINITY_DN16767_c0_g1~~TRINITY_DN16767_c0_g1_i1.p1  ORF type:complete len:180 (-),score=32.53 TRINITY_DN16767_c0_g1_i1:241-780(-)
MPPRGLTAALNAQALQEWLQTSFADAADKEHDDAFFEKEVETLDLSPTAEVLPLCEDLNPGTVGNGDSCWSTCNGQCPNDVLQDGLAFDFDEIAPGHPGCTSHFECVGNKDRVLCHAVQAKEEPLFQLAMPVDATLAVTSYAPRRQNCSGRSEEKTGRQCAQSRHQRRLQQAAIAMRFL